ncbi:hypothetical protein QWY90_06415 [Flavobacterium paronense]|uniref:DUF4382 domain-containing protein n=1 Tax=Flavobacterium paronense TaxID=1392775 RepID=A0ABV5GFZ2_9FLAO|nr:hypothetical protein [Flavobacterium paronense]MDN3676940.1 hypothetical protein [Flavobacterium paronense]
MKSLKALIGIMVLFIMVTSCSSDSSSSTNKMTIIGKATYTNPSKTNVTLSPLTSGVVLTSFKINIKEIEFQVAEGSEEEDHHGNGGDDNHDGMYNGDDETQLNGPWELDLLNQTAPLTTVTIANGTYEEVKFKLNKSLVSTSDLYNKTMEIRGTINGTPFVYWHDFESEFEIDYHDAAQNLVVSNGSFDLIINIDLNQVLSSVDLTSAVDGNGNGTIEIGPNDTDGNNALAQQLNDDLDDATEMEDHHD